MNEKRKGWHEYFMDMARLVATRSTCDRARVGCVLVNDKRILACGYNASLSGDSHCDDVGHFMHEGHCIRTLHAEESVISFAAKNGIAINGSTLYCTHHPCTNCLKSLAASGIVTVYYEEEYRIEDIPAFIKGRVRIIKFDKYLVNEECIVRKDYL